MLLSRSFKISNQLTWFLFLVFKKNIEKTVLVAYPGTARSVAAWFRHPTQWCRWHLGHPLPPFDEYRISAVLTLRFKWVEIQWSRSAYGSLTVEIIKWHCRISGAKHWTSSVTWGMGSSLLFELEPHVRRVSQSQVRTHQFRKSDPLLFIHMFCLCSTSHHIDHEEHVKASKKVKSDDSTGNMWPTHLKMTSMYCINR